MHQRTALLSVFHKDGIVEFAKELIELGFNILASGGTAKTLSDAGIEVKDTAELVGKAILGHRVVTLSREIHSGLLARDIAEDRTELKKLNIPWIDLVCVDLYPLEEEVGRIYSKQYTVNQAREAVIEKTDIGGPTMLRSAAKGGRITVCDPVDRKKVIDWLKSGEPDKENFLEFLFAKTEKIIADYCLVSAHFHSGGTYDGFVGEQIAQCKYGENGWQTPAGLFKTSSEDLLGLSNFKLVAGQEPSYNNWCDVDRLLQTSSHIAAAFDINGGKVPCIAVGVKHGNPCGASASQDPKTAVEKMLEGDLRAIFGGVVMVNVPVDEALAEVLLTHKMHQGQRRLLDGIIAPRFTEGAIAALKRKGDKCRFLTNSALSSLSKASLDVSPRMRYVRGGFLRQPNYTFILDLNNPQLEKSGISPQDEESDMLLAWAIGSTSNSNTVTLVKDGQLIGNGVGQQDRVGCCQLAIKRATDSGHEVSGAAAFSDSFFPFVDGPQVLISAGIKNIIATSGSVRDGEVKEVCKSKGVNLYLVPDTVARGFFGH